ncbi:transposase, MuDR [Tanacetum coccineum]
MVFKVDFEKAFDSIRWDYLQDILKMFGFGDIWCGWINSCLNSAMGSVLVNGSPTTEFQFHKGLKQRDPLSPFLFILIMESLHLSLSKVKDACLFSGIPIDSSLTISHIFFADDAIFIRIVTRPEEVDAAAPTIGCSTFTTPFVHLGVKVGGAMSRIKSWDDVVAKVSFIKAIYGEDGALNSPNYLSKRSPWLDIIREVTVFRTKGINLLDLIRKKVGNRLKTLFWEDHWLDDLALKHKFLRLYAFDNYKQIIVVEKTNHASMVDTFRRPSRGGAEEVQLGSFLSRMDGLILTNIPDRWVWSLEAIGEFSVKSVRHLIDDSILLKEEVATSSLSILQNCLWHSFSMMEDDYLPSYVIDPSNLHLKEYFRKEGIHFDPVYGKIFAFLLPYLNHGGKFTPSPIRMYVRGKVNYVDNIDVDLFNVDELHMFLQDLGYDPKQLMLYHYKLPNKSLDYGLRPLIFDADVVSLINLVANCKVVEVFVEYWLTNVDHRYLSPFKSTVEIKELDDDVLWNAPVVGSSKRLALGWINEAGVGESSVGKNDNVNVVGSSKSLALDIDENLNLDDYTVYVDENMNENVNADDENVNADDEYEQDDVEDEEVIGNDREDFIVDEEHVIDEVEVNMEGFTFSVQEQGAEQTVTPNVDLTDEALEVLDFDSFDSDVGDDTASITRRSLRKLRKTGGQSCGIVNTLFVGQEFANKELAKARIKAYAVETRRKIRIVKNDTERLQAKFGVSKTKAFRAKAKAEVHLRGDQEQQYALLWDYYHALKKANPNTTIKIDVYRAHNPHENVRRFKRIYVCLGALKDGFRASGRQLLGLDGAFMKRNYLDDLELEADSNFTFITDRQKGLLPALKDLFPAAEHRYCVRHIHDNMNLIYKGGQYKELLWKCATATTEVHFERAMDEFKGQLLQARDSPVITALEYVREYLMKRIMIVQKVIEKSQGPLTATVNEGRQNQVVVNLANRSCTCRKWEVSGILCKHAVACIFNMNDNGMQVGLPKNWVHQLMKLQTWKTVYSFKINPVPGRQFWEKSQVPLRLIPPYISHQVGRPGKKRKKSVGEVTEMVKDGKLIRKGGTVTCCKCGQKGDNKRSCKRTSVAGSGSACASASQPARAKQPQRQPERAASQPASASACTPKPTRQTKIKNVVASGSHGAKKTPTRQSQRQKASKKAPTTK